MQYIQYLDVLVPQINEMNNSHVNGRTYFEVIPTLVCSYKYVRSVRIYRG